MNFKRSMARAGLCASALAGLLSLSLPATASPPDGSQPGPRSPTAAPVSATPTFLGPADADMRPGPKPLDLRARARRGVEREWLTKDVEMIWRVRASLPPSAQASDFLRTVPADPGTLEEADLGFGLLMHTARVAGGYTTCWFRLVSHADAILSLRAECAAHTPANEGIGPILTEALGAAFTVQPGNSLVARAEYHSPSASSAARALLDQALGAQAPVSTDSLSLAVREPYERLLSPFDELTVGNACGIVGASPPGRDAMLALVAAQRVDLLRNVLRGPNPGGRIYAAQGLAKLQALSREDQAIVSALSSSPTPIATCGGCIFSKSTGARALAVKVD